MRFVKKQRRRGATTLKSRSANAPGQWKTFWEAPLRWLGVRGMYSAYKVADRHEAGGRSTTSPIAVVADKIAGRP